MTLKVWLVTGDDYMDDPAWGSSPLFVGAEAEIREYFSQRGDLIDQAVVQVEDGRTIWARAWLETSVAGSDG